MRIRCLCYLVSIVGLAVLLTSCQTAWNLPLSSADSHPRTRILMFYIDGLRPDTVDEMVEAHELPYIEELFYKNGLRLPNTFTGFPSNTLAANGLFMTGRWSGSTGLKSQALFERYEVPGQRRLQSLSNWILRRQDYPRYFNLLTQTDVAPMLLKKNHVSTLFDYLGKRFHSTVIPIHPDTAPLVWPHVAVNVVPHFYKVTLEAPEEIDRINAEYALRYMLMDDEAEVFLIWFPGFDEAQHAEKTGQFGKARDKLRAMDQSIGEIYHGIRHGMKDPSDRLFVILFSDHGGYGGRDGHYNQPFHIARDYFYKELKMNVRGPDFSLTYPGTDAESYAFVDNMGRGQAKIYLPYRDSLSANWSRRNTFYDLRHYGLGPNRKAVDLITDVSAIDLSHRNDFPQKTSPYPVELLFVKISPEIIYLRRFDGAEGLIFIKEEGQRETYRYLPVQGFDQTEDGKVHYVETFERDPLGYLEDPGFDPPQGRKSFLTGYHDSNDWLQTTYKTAYPDAVVLLAKFFQWDDPLRQAELSRSPDLVLSAAPGWNFRIEDIPSGDHGSLRTESVRSTFMISGPGLKKGVLETPHRLIQIPPTIFALLGIDGPSFFDEPPMGDIHESKS